MFQTLLATGSRWALPATPDFVKALQSDYADPAVYPLDDRGLVFTYVFFTPKHRAGSILPDDGQGQGRRNRSTAARTIA